MVYDENRSVMRGPRSLARAVLAALAVVAFTYGASPASAQQPQGAAPKKPAGAAQPKQTQSSWVKLCDKAKGLEKNICLTHHERLDGNTGRVLVSAALRKIEGQDSEQFLVMVPLGMAIPPGVQVRIDKEKPIPLKYTICHSAGCTAEIPATKEIVDKLRKGNKMVVAAINIAGKAIGFPVPLNGFTKAYEGAPIDNKKYQDARRQLMQMIRKRQAELAKKARDAQEKKKLEAPGLEKKQ
ncbi:MAG: invasion associated locus B family protein [Hyphomicrobiales bacterium]|nr:invasion associated locus B family protein [Hyphomicrobiales bacterium]